MEAVSLASARRADAMTVDVGGGGLGVWLVFTFTFSLAYSSTDHHTVANENSIGFSLCMPPKQSFRRPI